jgi:hypothetical protein
LTANGAVEAAEAAGTIWDSEERGIVKRATEADEMTPAAGDAT